MESEISSSRIIPPELTDFIISFIELGDCTTLASCALVCRSWLPASQRRLFQLIRFWPNSRWRYDLLVSNVLHDEKSKHLLGAVHHIFIDDGENEDTLSAVAYHFLPTFPHHLPNLRVLEFAGCSWINRSHPHLGAVMAAMSSFPSLTELSLIGVTFPLFGFFRRMVIAIPALTNLTLSRIRWPHTSLPAWLTLPARSPRQLSLCTLKLEVFLWTLDVTDVLLPWLSKTIAAETIDSLVVHSLPEHFVEHDFFKHVGPHVTKLTIDLQLTGNTFFSNFTNLTDITIINSWACEPPEGECWVRVQAIVDGNPSRLRRLRVTDLSPKEFLSNQSVSDHDDADQRPFDAPCGPYLSLLDTSLAQDRYKDLESVHFGFLTVTKHTFDTTKPPVIKRVPPECQSYVVRKLPKLSSRGVKISVSYGY